MNRRTTKQSLRGALPFGQGTIWPGCCIYGIHYYNIFMVYLWYTLIIHLWYIYGILDAIFMVNIGIPRAIYLLHSAHYHS